jgi:dihydroorotase
VAGGITSFMEMPNSNPATLSLDLLEAKHARAAEVSRANYSFYLGASNDNIDAIRAVRVGQCCGVKVFMGASTGNMLVDNEQTLDAIFADSPLLIATHCEDTPTIQANEAEFRARYGEDVPMSAHPLIRSEAACLKSSTLAVALARRHDASGCTSCTSPRRGSWTCSRPARWRASASPPRPACITCSSTSATMPTRAR